MADDDVLETPSISGNPSGLDSTLTNMLYMETPNRGQGVLAPGFVRSPDGGLLRNGQPPDVMLPGGIPGWNDGLRGLSYPPVPALGSGPENPLIPMVAPVADFGQSNWASRIAGSPSPPMGTLAQIAPFSTQSQPQESPQTSVLASKSPLDIIEQYESRGQNIPNYRFDDSHTAQGYYQITDSNWKSYGPKVGVDLSQYPSAIAAPKDLQAKVAQSMYDEAGYAPWAKWNPALAQAVGFGAPQAPDFAGIKTAATNVLNAPPAGTAPSSDISQAMAKALGVPQDQTQSPYQRLMLMSMIQKLTNEGTHQFVPISYDPWKYLPHKESQG